ncbi:hypothetical protein [Bacillus sp. AFS023182]|nr:hypothetical protein [Bacillus sp. AFS023182]
MATKIIMYTGENCGKCGSEIEYSREVEVTHSTRPVKRNNPIKL